MLGKTDVIEDNHVACMLSHLNDATAEVENSRGGKDDAPDILKISLEQKNDTQFSELKTIPVLCRPEFFQGTLNNETCDQVKRAIAASLQCRQMCVEWGKLAVSAGRKSQINDKILTWWQKEIIPDDSDRPKPASLASQGNKEVIKPRNEKMARQGSPRVTPASLGTMFRNVFCCCCSPGEYNLPDISNQKNAQIFIKKLNGTIFSLGTIATELHSPDKAKESDLVLTESVRALKGKIHDSTGIHPNLQVLVFKNESLDDDKLLHECGISPQSMLYLIQLRSVLGLDENVRVTATEEGDLKFTEEKFRGLYRWYRDGQQRPDVYMGEFLNGMLLDFETCCFL
jgi:hypothetical protein